jgi:hypothetical protein
MEPTVTTPEFLPFPKIPRWNREVIITEKIDGTNALVHVADDGAVTAGSRNRWVYPGADNFGWAAWVKQNEVELRELGPGYHYGEWWGGGIQRGYGRKDRSFSLFNAPKYAEAITYRIPCCRVVPLLYRGPMSERAIAVQLELLRHGGSVAEPGYMNPEGLVIFHTAAGRTFKVLLENDDQPKGS